MNADQSFKEIINALSKGGFDSSDKRLTALLNEFGITTHNPDGSWKSIQLLLNEIAEVWNKET